jgi:hypothetical protein
MTDASNVVTTVATGVAQTVATTVKADATAEVTSLSTHWHVPVWAVLVILGIGVWAVLHFVL